MVTSAGVLFAALAGVLMSLGNTAKALPAPAILVPTVIAALLLVRRPCAAGRSKRGSG